MKRFIAMTSIAAMTIGGAALAQDADTPTEAEMNAIMTYAPEATMAEISALSDQQIDSLVAYINSGETEDDKRRHVQAMFTEPGNGDGETVYIVETEDRVTEAERDMITSYAPDVTMADIQALTDQQVDQLVASLHSGETESEKRRYVQSFFE